MVGNRAHADLIAQVTDGDIRHTVGAQLFPQHIAAGLQGGHVQPDGIVTDPQGSTETTAAGLRAASSAA